MADDLPGPPVPAVPRQSTRRERLAGAAVVLVGFAAVVVSMRHNGAILHHDELATSWQLDSPRELTGDLLASTWYRHVQPPLYNLVVGAVLSWSPFPAVGTVFVLFLAALAATGLLVADLLARWGVPPVAAGAASALAMSNPNLLSTIVVSSYEVPVILLLVLSLWLFQRHLDQPRSSTLVWLSVALTALALTRSLFHPAWVLAVLGVAVAARRVPWRHAALAAAIPVLLVGGWMVKNQVLFGTATTSSWLGFNLQRGVVAPMARADVEAAVADGTVTGLALEDPWLGLDRYQPWLDGCRPSDRHPSLELERRVENGAPNYNHECYLVLYAQSVDNATALVRAHPGRYLATRLAIMPTSFAMADLGVDGAAPSPAGQARPTRTWMDAAADVWLLPVDTHIDMSDWNLPLLGAPEVPYRLSLTLLLLSVGIGGRSALAAWRLVRVGWSGRESGWPTGEVLWLVVGATVAVVIVGGNLIEFGENGRFRATLDPLLVALPLGGLARLVRSRRAPAAGGPATAAASGPLNG